jgi:hypothetical protein
MLINLDIHKIAEGKNVKYAKIILEFKKEKIDGKTVIEHETELSKLNRKILIIKDFKDYIKKKSEINNKLYKFYEKYIFRKLKLNGYMNRKKNEQKLINNFTTETILNDTIYNYSLGSLPLFLQSKLCVIINKLPDLL